jgi:hypothetical protein
MGINPSISWQGSMGLALAKYYIIVPIKSTKSKASTYFQPFFIKTLPSSSR